MVHSEGMFSIFDDCRHMSVLYAQLRQHKCSVFMPLSAESAVCVDKKERSIPCIFNFFFYVLCSRWKSAETNCRETPVLDVC